MIENVELLLNDDIKCPGGKKQQNSVPNNSM